MNKIIKLVILGLVTLIFTACSSNGSEFTSFSLSPIYDTDNETYFSLLFSNNDNSAALTKTSVLNKETGEFYMLEDGGSTDDERLWNYTSGGFQEGDLNNPIFYNTYTDEFIDIRTGESIEITDECRSILSSRKDCNILDNDLQVLLRAITESGDYKVELSNYISDDVLTSYSFTIDDSYEELKIKIHTYSNYDRNKVGIKINFSVPGVNIPQEFVDSIILEYTINTNCIELLFRGSEYNSFNFQNINNCYIFGLTSSNTLYKYDINEQLLLSTEKDGFNVYVSNGYWFGEINNELSVYKYDSELNASYVSNANISGFVSTVLLGELIFEIIDNNDLTYTYKIHDGNTGDVILELDGGNKEVIKYLLE